MSTERPVWRVIITIANMLTFARLVLLPVVIVGVATDNGWLAVGAMFAR